jgi:exopolyphosphatase/guanosine-5'-triphosphate,3'-diphosphate pyrophosphatase
LTTEIATRRVAAFDLGTNSLRVLIADCSSDGSYKIQDDEKIPCRLGEGLERSGELSAAAMKRTSEALKKAMAIARGYNVVRIEAIATSACRDAANGPAFVERIRRELGLELRVITGEVEARLAHLSLRRHFDLSKEPAIVCDLGGGSLDVLVTARGDLVEDLFTFPLGAVRMTEAHLPDPAITASQYKKLRKAAHKALAAKLSDYREHGHRLYGSGGSLTCLARMMLIRRGGKPEDVMGFEIARSDLRHLREMLRSLPLDARKNVPGLSADRADIIVAAAVVIEETMRVLDAETITVSSQGIREGLLLELIGEEFKDVYRPTSPAQSRETGLRAFARSCGYEEGHAELVRELSLTLLEEIGVPEGCDLIEARQLIEAAALLHDIGTLVRYQGHHKHSAHLISHAELAAFSPRFRRLVALIARFHTGKPPKKSHRELVGLDKRDNKLVRWLAGILRLTDALDRCHCQRVRRISIDRSHGALHILAEASSNPELELWAAAKKADLLSKMLDQQVLIEGVVVDAEPAPVRLVVN